jgi:hypothetical protein
MLLLTASSRVENSAQVSTCRLKVCPWLILGVDLTLAYTKYLDYPEKNVRGANTLAYLNTPSKMKNAVLLE